MNNIPIPADIPLPIPGSIPFFKGLLIVSLILHLIFVGVTLGGTVVSLLCQYIGYKKKDDRYTRLSAATAKFSFVNKSIAIVLGVAPMLLISVLYTGYFYSSSIIIGKVWMSLIPLLIIAFLLIYVYEMKMEEISAGHLYPLFAGMIGCLMLLFVPLIFAVNMVLMRLPEQWTTTHSFWQAVLYATVIPRYFHFLLACFVVTGFMIYLYAFFQSKKEYLTGDASYYNWAANFGAATALHALSVQVLLGTLLFFSHDRFIRDSFLKGGINTWLLISAILLIIVILILLFRMRQGLRNLSYSAGTSLLPEAQNEIASAIDADLLYKKKTNKWWLLPGLLLILLLLMGMIRHQIREMSLEPYQQRAGNISFNLRLDPLYIVSKDTGKQVTSIG